MFSKNDSAKPSNITQLSEAGYIVYTNYVNLSKDYVLLIACNEGRTETTIKLFKINNLMDCIKQEKFQGRYSFSGSMTPNTFMLSKENTNEFIKLNSESLKIEATIFLTNFDNIYALNEEYFFTFNSIKPDPRRPFELRFYQWDDRGPILKQEMPLIRGPINNAGSMYSIQTLGNGQFAAHISWPNSLKFIVLIFACSLNPQTQNFEIQICRVITPSDQNPNNNLIESGKVLALPNGHLLTYHEHHDGLHIWNTTNGECIKKWYWSDLKPKENFVSFIKITPFPDQKHLLIHRKDSLFIFNINQLTLKPITLKNINCFGNHHILPNGKLLAFHEFNNNNNTNLLRLSLFDTPLTRAYNRDYLNAKVLTFLYFAKVLYLPDELSLHIISYAFTPEAKHQFIINCPDNLENNTSSIRCSIM
ncbi:MAG: hypothetical protein Q8M40_12035 [Legionella sp.]|nr:hypothetical protein [Legionella sp.]